MQQIASRNKDVGLLSAYSLTILNFEENQYVWRFKHPSIRDAFAQFVGNDVELLEIYLGGAPLNKLLQEVACVDIKMDGLKVIVPESHYQLLIGRMKKFKKTDWYNKKIISSFFAKRCNQEFLSAYLKNDPSFLDNLIIHRSFFMNSDLQILIKFFEVGLLSEDKRSAVAASIHRLAIEEYDTQFTKDETKILLTKTEFSSIQNDVKSKIISNMECIIGDLSSDYDSESDPEDHFSNINYAIDDYENLFLENDEICTQLSKAKDMIENEIKELSNTRKDVDDDTYDARTHSVTAHKTERSIFEDIDS
jgi:hypothetical protein